MKGIVILVLLVAAIVGGTCALLHRSDADLVRLEDAIGAQVDAAAASLNDVTLRLTPLRAIKPNVTAIDLELQKLREELEKTRRALEAFRASRPGENGPRGEFLDQRRAIRESSTALAGKAKTLLDKVVLVDDFMRKTQERVQLMRDAVTRLYKIKNDAAAAGKTIAPELQLKLESLAQKANEMQQIAREFMNSDSRDLAQARTMAATVANETETVIASLQTLAVDIQRALGER